MTYRFVSAIDFRDLLDIGIGFFTDDLPRREIQNPPLVPMTRYSPDFNLV
jgi:hypothetical protein